MTGATLDVLRWVLYVAAPVAAFAATGHALLTKRDPRAAFGWIAFCLVFPLAGPLLYSIFGVNRIRTRAQKLTGAGLLGEIDSPHTEAQREHGAIVPVADEYRELARIADAVTGQALLRGNRVEPLFDGEGAFPPMLEAIRAARERVVLATYIFESNATGRAFVAALADAAARGVEVRVLLDGVGELYSWPRVRRLLGRRNVRVARFLPPRLIPPQLHVNLRNHRKILVCDGRIAFTGGMNLGDRHLTSDRDNEDRVSDLHFALRGPVVAQIEAVFAADWRFVTGEELGPAPVDLETDGDALCRAVVDGPNEDFDRLVAIVVGAVSAAHRRVSIVTPYFLPPRELIAALQSAALRGVAVEVILPARNNLPFVHWATCNMLEELLERRVRVFYQPPPFAHTKLLLVDDHYALIGSANLDPRSLRLNFELGVEVYGHAFAATMAAHVDRLREPAHEVTLEEVASRSLPVRIRDATAWLFTPYL